MTDLHDKITNTIIEQLEAGTRPWIKPWGNPLPLAIPKNETTGKKYRGINIPLLWMATEANNFQSHEWATYKQWKEAGEQVAAKQQHTMIIFYKMQEKEVDGKLQQIPVIRASQVFNRCQLTSYEPKEVSPLMSETLPERLNVVDQFMDNTKAVIEHTGNAACYIPSQDKILMPPAANFTATATSTRSESYYATLLHEAAHWSGHPNRCNRKLRNRYGSNAYAFEELVAELSSAFLCAELGISNEPREDHASYLASWLDVLKQDKKAILSAASEATKACDFLESLQAERRVMVEPAQAAAVVSNLAQALKR